MTAAEIRKLAFIAATCALLAAVLLAQALSGVLAKRSAEMASALFPLSGIALEQRAFDVFTANMSDLEEMTEPARAAQSEAQRAHAAGPLAPKAHAILALSAVQPDKRAQILEAASALNRRDIALQGLVLEKHVAAGDYPAMLQTLDQMLRINVQLRELFFPALVDALKQPDARDSFIEMLDMSAPWHELFLFIALDDGEARLALAGMRGELAIDHPEFDRWLVSRLATQGEFDVAKRLYEQQRRGRSVGASGSSAWAVDLPPFDWQLTDEAGLRSQPSRSGEQLEIFARSGNGGVVAQRLMALPAQGFAITTAITASPAPREGAVRLEITCAATGAPLFAAPLSNGANRISVNRLDSECALFRLTLHARSRQGEQAIRADLDPLTISPS